MTQIFDPAPQAAYPGEVMACVFCDVKDIAVSSLPAWESLQVGERRYYACPEEFPTEGDLTEAYVRFFTRVATMTAPQRGIARHDRRQRGFQAQQDVERRLEEPVIYHDEIGAFICGHGFEVSYGSVMRGGRVFWRELMQDHRAHVARGGRHA